MVILTVSTHSIKPTTHKQLIWWYQGLQPLTRANRLNTGDHGWYGSLHLHTQVKESQITDHGGFRVYLLTPDSNPQATDNGDLSQHLLNYCYGGMRVWEYAATYHSQLRLNYWFGGIRVSLLTPASNSKTIGGMRVCNHLPQPTTPKPLIIVVCESVPTKLSGYRRLSVSNTTLPRYSRFTWCTMPEPGGTISMFLKAFAPH